MLYWGGGQIRIEGRSGGGSRTSCCDPWSVEGFSCTLERKSEASAQLY